LKTKVLKLVLLLLTFSFADELTISDGEFISNNLYSVAVKDSFIAITPSNALNFSTINSTSSGDLNWSGVKNISTYGDTLGGLSARVGVFMDSLVSVAILESDVVGEVVLLYSELDAFAGEEHSVENIYNYSGVALSDSLEFYGFNGVFYNEQAYLAAYDGGVLVTDISGEDAKVLIPFDDTIHQLSSYSLDAELADSQKVLSVEKIGDTLFALTNTHLLKTAFANIAWSSDSLPFEIFNETGDVGFSPYGLSSDGVNLYILGVNGSGSIISTRKDGVYSNSEIEKRVSQISPVGNNNLILLDESQASVPLSVFDVTSGEIDEQMSEQLRARITAVSGFNYENARYRGISFSSFNENYTFAIATSLGLLYDDNFSFSSRGKFTLVRRKVSIASGLDQVYAVPTIMSGDVDRVYLEYSLSSDDRVSILIYDYNLDFVTKIVDGEFRKKGSSNSTGHSSDNQYDYWDGTVTNRGGRTVAPGLYYFRITAEKGGRAFGKIIIAKD
jgi:hypothetical protein